MRWVSEDSGTMDSYLPGDVLPVATVRITYEPPVPGSRNMKWRHYYNCCVNDNMMKTTSASAAVEWCEKQVTPIQSDSLYVIVWKRITRKLRKIASRLYVPCMG